MGIVVDSSVVIRAERLRVPVDLSRWQHRGTPFLSAITVSELLVGIHRANSDSRREARRLSVEQILGSMAVLDFDAAVARTHAALRAETLQRGKPIGAHDLLIAATAKHHGLPVLTCNVAEFSQVSGLEVLDYEAGTNSSATSTTQSPSP